jgi:hypothetical protein
MRLKPKVAVLVSAAGALAIAVPATAHPGPNHDNNGNHGTGNSQNNGNHGNRNNQGGDHPSQSHKCKPHNAGYIESGMVDMTTASTLAKNADGTWSGTLVVDVTRANHWAKSARGTTVTVTFANAKLHVDFDGGTTGFTGGERVKLIGKLAVVGKKCPALTPPSTPMFKMVVVHPAKS